MLCFCVFTGFSWSGARRGRGPLESHLSSLRLPCSATRMFGICCERASHIPSLVCSTLVRNLTTVSYTLRSRMVFSPDIGLIISDTCVLRRVWLARLNGGEKQRFCAGIRPLSWPRIRTVPTLRPGVATEVSLRQLGKAWSHYRQAARVCWSNIIFDSRGLNQVLVERALHRACRVLG